MRKLLASLLLLGALGASAAHAGRWDLQRQPLFASNDRGERRPLFQRRQAEPQPPSREAQRFQAPPQPAQQNTESAPSPPAFQRPALQPAEAGRRAQQRYGGRVLSVSPSDSGYHVRLLRNGEVSVVTVPNNQ